MDHLEVQLPPLPSTANKIEEFGDLQASSSGTGSIGFYEGAGVNSVEVESPYEDLDPTVAELRGCEMLEDVMEVVTEEAGLMSTAGIAFAISRCASLAKKGAKGQGNKVQAKKGASKITKGQEFAFLLSLIQAKACEMTVQEVTTCLQSMAALEVKVVRVLRVLQAEIQARLTELDERQMATVAWSFGSLKHNPGALLDLLADAATPRLDSFELHGLSTMLWAYGKLEHAPAPDFISRMVWLFNEKMENFSPQSIANMMYSFGKMRRPLKASVCRKVEKAVLARPAAFKDLEVSNILYGFVKTRYNSPELLGVMEDRIAQKTLTAHTAAMAWATLVWGAASMGLPLRGATLGALQEWGLREAAPFNPPSLCNLAWGLAILGEVQHPVFPQVVALVVESHQRRTLEPRLMRQLFQAVSAARILGAELSIPEAVEGTAHKWWRHGTQNNPISMSHEVVAKAIRKLGLDSEAQHNAGYGLPSIDVAIEAEDGRDIALMVVSPGEYSINADDQKPLGSMLSKKRLLEAAKWQVEIIPANSLPSLSNEPACIKYVGKVMEGLGVQTDWATAVKKAPVPVPKAIGSNRSRGMEPRGAFAAPSESASKATPSSENLVPESSLEAAAPAISTGLPTHDSWNEGAETGAKVTGKDGARRERGEERETGKKVVEPVTAEEVRKQQAQARRRREEIEKGMTGDFMAGWVNLSEWKSMKTVVPSDKQ